MPSIIPAIPIAVPISSRRSKPWPISPPGRPVGDGRKLTIHTPLITLSKADIIRTGLKLGVDYGITTSCYDPTEEGLACGHCDACKLRLKGFSEAGLTDPARYA